MPYVSFLAINYDIPEINDVLYWFESCIVQNYAHPLVEHRIMLRNDEKFKQNLLKALHDMDIDIVDYRYDEETKRLFTQRQIGEQKVELPVSGRIRRNPQNYCSSTHLAYGSCTGALSYY